MSQVKNMRKAPPTSAGELEALRLAVQEAMKQYPNAAWYVSNLWGKMAGVLAEEATRH